MDKWRSPRAQYVIALAISSLISVALFGYGALRTHSLEHHYLVWNLFLAWLPLLLVVRLLHILMRKAWSSWEGLLISFLWIIFLPNSFYLISDLIHLQEVQPARVLYDSVMFFSFIINGVMLGFSSLYLIHLQIRRRLGAIRAGAWVGVILLFCSIAIYIGRDLRWNTWDIIFNPAGLLFDVSDRIQHPSSYPHMLLVIAAFFVLLAGTYNMIWRAARLFVRAGSRS